MKNGGSNPLAVVVHTWTSAVQYPHRHLPYVSKFLPDYRQVARCIKPFLILFDFHANRVAVTIWNG